MQCAGIFSSRKSELNHFERSAASLVCLYSEDAWRARFFSDDLSARQINLRLSSSRTDHKVLPLSGRAVFIARNLRPQHRQAAMCIPNCLDALRAQPHSHVAK
jgi:hypothetical protein